MTNIAAIAGFFVGLTATLLILQPEVRCTYTAHLELPSWEEERAECRAQVADWISQQFRKTFDADMDARILAKRARPVGFRAGIL